MNEIIKELEENIIDILELPFKKERMPKLLLKEEMNKLSLKNYVNDFIEKKIDYNTFLKLQHKNHIESAKEYLLFPNFKLFKESLDFCLDKMSVPDNLQDVLNHEKAHCQSARKYNLECLFYLKFSIDSTREEKPIMLWPGIVIFAEKKALEEDWPLKKYLQVIQEVGSVVSDPSEQDSQNIELVKIIADTYSINL